MHSLKEKYLLFKAKTLKDADSYGEIYDRYSTRIYRFIFFKVGNESDAEDLASEVFLKAWQYIKEGQPVKNLNAFLYSIARNLVIDHYRFQAKKQEFEETPAAEIGVASNVVEKMDTGDRREDLLKAIKLLKNEYCEVLLMRYFDDLSLGDIAEVIGKSYGNTRVLLHRAVGALKKAVDKNEETL